MYENATMKAVKIVQKGGGEIRKSKEGGYDQSKLHVCVEMSQ
jgi:hypothetical protein